LLRQAIFLRAIFNWWSFQPATLRIINFARVNLVGQPAMRNLRQQSCLAWKTGHNQSGVQVQACDSFGYGEVQTLGKRRYLRCVENLEREGEAASQRSDGV